LYCRGKDNGVNILKSIEEGPYILGTFRETLDESTEGTPQFGLERPRVYSDLNSNERDRYNADIRATNILLQGLPKDIYTLTNHYTDAKNIWDNVKMLFEGFELTKEDRESQLYDDFEHFRQHKEESINDYYVRFSKLINDMRNIKMTMPKLQLNSKFVNNMLPEWDIQCAGSDTRPPMFDRTDITSWQQRIRLYCRGKKNGVNILKSIDEGAYQIGTVREPLAEGIEGAPQLGPERPRVYSDLSPEEKDRYNADIRATNILLQGLPKDIYTLINHYIDAKDIWDNVKMLLEGSKLTKKDRESQLNIKMTMSRMQLNSKFVNNMLPEWGKFVTAVKLNRGLRDSNYDQLNQATVQDGRVVVQNVQGRQNRGQGMNPWGGGAAEYGGVQNRVGNANLGQARQVKCYNCNGKGHIARNCTQPKRPQNSEYCKDKMLLMQAQENGVALDAKQLLFLAGGQDNAFDDDVDEQLV
nr:hypothetical protein [Tanacetum cinerariifolium]